MSDLISRQDAIDALYDWSNHTMTDAEAWHLRQVIGDIKSMPSAEPERPKGKWETHPGMNETCSECGHYFPVSEFDRRPFVINFCPYCGADMRGEL